MSGFMETVAYALRRARRRPLALIVITATFGLSIGAVTTIASLADAALLRPLPLRSAQDLIWIWNARVDRDKAFFSVADWLDFRDRQRTLAGLSALANWSANQTGTGEPERVQGVRATANFFAVLGARPAVGRLFSDDDGRPGGAAVFVATWRYWQRKLAGDEQAIGRAFTFNSEPYELVGVLPRDFPTRLPGTDADTEVFAVITPETEARRGDRDDNFLRGVGRLAPGTTLEQASADFARIQAELRGEYPDANAKKVAPRLLPLRDEIVGDLKPVLQLLAGAVTLVLLLACMNIAIVKFAEALERDRERAIRVALGARRAQLFRQFLTESLVTASLGGAFGVLLAPFALRACLKLVPPAVIPAASVQVSGTALGIALVTVCVAALTFGMVPAFRPFGQKLERSLRDEGRASTPSRRHTRILRAIVALEVAFAFLLLAVAGLLFASLRNVTRVDPGFAADGVLTARLSVPQTRYPDLAAFMRFVDSLEAGLTALPSVAGTAVSNVLPLSSLNVRRDFSIVGQPPPAGDAVPGAQVRYVSESYFASLRIRLLRGSDFGKRARADTRRVAVVDRALAERFFGNGDPVGAELRTGDLIWTIVGVVADVKYDKLDDPPTPTLYLPLGQIPDDTVGFLANRFSLVVRTSGDPNELIQPLKRVLGSIDADVPASVVRPLTEWVGDTLASRRLVAVLLALFGSAAVGLASLGVYGLVVQTVVRRTHEIGVRVALGADARTVFRMALIDSLRLMAVGLAGGLIAFWALGPVIRHFLFGITPTDPLVTAASLFAIALVAVSATIIPARRAATIDPLSALR